MSNSIGSLRRWRELFGELPAFVDGGYPVIYYTREGLTICAKCANKTDTSDPVRVGEVFYEGADEECEDCGAVIESAYGDPDEGEQDLAVTFSAVCDGTATCFCDDHERARLGQR